MTPAEVWALADQATGDPYDPDWSGAPCAQSDPEAWFPEPNARPHTARRICQGCELRADCLAFALVHDERFGVWGGTTAPERAAAKRWARAASRGVLTGA